MIQEGRRIAILPMKITVASSDGAVTSENKTTDKEYKRIIGFAVTYNDPANLAGSTLNIVVGGKTVFKKAIETALFTFDSACPVMERYFTDIDEPIDNSLIELVYTAGNSFPDMGDTAITVSFQCTLD